MERIYTIPLRQDWLKKPRVKRAPRAIRDIKAFIARHTKAEHVTISKAVNQAVWASGIQRPPGKIKVKVSIEEGKALVQLPGEVTTEKELEKIAEKVKGKEVKDESVQTGAAVQAEPAAKTS